MEAWYDQWLRAVGSAVIVGPSDFAGQIPDHAVADMAPPLRRPCARLESRMTILSDGRIVTCEQDVLGRQTLGSLGEIRSRPSGSSSSRRSGKNIETAIGNAARFARAAANGTGRE